MTVQELHNILETAIKEGNGSKNIYYMDTSNDNRINPIDTCTYWSARDTFMCDNCIDCDIFPNLRKCLILKKVTKKE